MTTIMSWYRHRPGRPAHRRERVHRSARGRVRRIPSRDRRLRRRDRPLPHPGRPSDQCPPFRPRPGPRRAVAVGAGEGKRFQHMQPQDSIAWATPGLATQFDALSVSWTALALGPAAFVFAAVRVLLPPIEL